MAPVHSYPPKIGLFFGVLKMINIDIEIWIEVDRYGSNGLIPLGGNCPEYPDEQPSCESGSGDSCCGGYMGENAHKFGDNRPGVLCGNIKFDHLIARGCK